MMLMMMLMMLMMVMMIMMMIMMMMVMMMMMPLVGGPATNLNCPPESGLQFMNWQSFSFPLGGGEATANKVRRKSLTRRGGGSEGLGKISESFPNNYSHLILTLPAPGSQNLQSSYY